MKKRILLYFLTIPSNFVNFFTLKYKRVLVGKNVKINGIIHVYGQGKIILSDNVRINSCRRANPIGGDIETVLSTGRKGIIIIGKNTGVSNISIVSRDSVTIGENCKIGGSVHIYDTDFHSIYAQERSNGDIGAKSSAITIGDNVFIGAHSIILKGVSIGSGSVVGAGSVITKNIPANEIWAGNPAKFIKKIDD